MFRFMAAAVLTALLGACANGGGAAYSGSNGKTLIVEPSVWSAYQDYAARISGTNPGTFIVVIVGDRAVSQAYSYCSAGNCRTDTFVSSVFSECKAKGLECAVFARSGSIALNYTLAE
jgi:hypothetical protein